MWPEDTAMERHLLEHSFMKSSIKIDKLILFWIIRKAHKNSMQISYQSQKDTLELLVKVLLHFHQGTVIIMSIHTYKLSQKILRKPNVGGLVSWYSLSIAHKKQEHKFNILWKLPKIIFIWNKTKLEKAISRKDLLIISNISANLQQVVSFLKCQTTIENAQEQSCQETLSQAVLTIL